MWCVYFKILQYEGPKRKNILMKPATDPTVFMIVQSNEAEENKSEIKYFGRVQLKFHDNVGREKLKIEHSGEE